MLAFDERAHLAVIGDGFIRTPFLTGTRETPRYRGPDECFPAKPSIIHLPAAGRRSGLNLANPTFRRLVLTSGLCEEITREEAAQLNHEAAGVTFKFHDKPNHNMARAHVNDRTLLRGERAMIVESTGVKIDKPIDFNELTPAQATTSFLAFLNNFWTDLRHIDTEIVLRHHIPLHFDFDFTMAYLTGGQSFTARIPIYGDVTGLKVYDRASGVASADISVILGGGTAAIEDDGLGGKVLAMAGVTASPNLGVCLINDAGEVFCRQIALLDEFPTQPYVFLPAALCGVAYECSIPVSSPYFTIDPQSMVLPAGLEMSGCDTISGTPTEYGTNFRFTASIIEPDGSSSQVTFIITVNRPQRDLLVIADRECNDRSTGEYYAALSQPFGSCIEYGGKLWVFRRHKSMGEPWPAVDVLPYSYLTSGRDSAAGLEEAWKDL